MKDTEKILFVNCHMNQNIFKTICDFYGWKNAIYSSIHSGLINNTWKVINNEQEFILQKINTNIFKRADFIDDNLRLLSDYFKEHHPDYLFTAPVENKNGETLCLVEDGHYRSFHFIKNSFTIDVVQNAGQAYEAAFQFGKFTALLNGLEVSKLKITLPDFHNLSLRYQQFDTAVQNGNPDRIAAVKNDILFIQSQKNIVEKFERFIQHPDAKQRVTHHDTKISNTLFDEHQKGLCVIDLDTIMPGYFLSDVGDMMRTYICPVSEEEADLNKVIVRKEFLRSIQEGYLAGIGNVLSAYEKDNFLLSGEVLIYMQAIRFLADYINNDLYYGCKYPTHNLVRARNQIKLLQEYQEAIKN